MKRLLLILVLLSLPAICLAQEKVYNNNDLKKGITPPPFVAQPGTRVVTPPPPGAPANRPANLNPPVQSQLFPIQNPNITIQYSPPVEPAVRSPQGLPPKPYYVAGSVEEALTQALAKVTLLMFLAVGIPFLIGLICLIDILRNEFTGHNKIIWFILVLFLPLVGSILYFFTGTDQKIRPEDEEEPVVRLI
jgi:hypothetical protein